MRNTCLHLSSSFHADAMIAIDYVGVLTMSVGWSIDGAGNAT